MAQMHPFPQGQQVNSPRNLPLPQTIRSRARWAAKADGEATTDQPLSHSRLQASETEALARPPLVTAALILLPSWPGRLAASIRPGTGTEEVITITALSEKEGMFMFQHRNYEVASSRRTTKVVRRYSDFVWLLDCLHKRYPFRQLPLLPPKRVASKLFLCKSSDVC